MGFKQIVGWWEYAKMLMIDPPSIYILCGGDEEPLGYIDSMYTAVFHLICAENPNHYLLSSYRFN